MMAGTAAAFITNVRTEVTHHVLQLRQRHLPNMSEILEREIGTDRDRKIDKATVFQELRNRGW